MAKLFRYLTKRQWAYVCAALVFIVAQVWLDLKLPDYMSEITTLVETKGSALADILMQGGYMLLCALGSMAASVIVGFLAAKVAAGLARTLRAMVYDKTMDFSMEEINRFSSSSLINRCTNDITQVQTLVAMGLQAIVKAPILAVWAVVKIAGKSWQWTTATAAAVLFLCLMLTLTLLFALPRFRRIQGLTDNLNRVTREQLTGIRVVRAFNAENYQESKFAQANDELTQTNLTANRVMALMSPTMTLINSGLTLAVYWIGAYLIESADAGAKLGIFSDMVVFSSYAMQVILAFMMLNMIFVLLPRAQVSAKRIHEVLNTQSRIRDGAGAADTGERGTVEFRHVSFRYPGAGSDTLTDISFKARRGETVALIGATGSGKTTLLNLIPRFYDAADGQILVDGADVRNCTQKSLRSRIGYVPQKGAVCGQRPLQRLLRRPRPGGNHGCGGSQCRFHCAGRGICGSHGGRLRRPHCAGRNQRLRRAEAAAGHCPRRRRKAGDFPVRRLLLGAGLQDRPRAAKSPWRADEGRHKDHCCPAHRHHSPCRPDSGAGAWKNCRRGNACGAYEKLSDLSGHRGLAAFKGGTAEWLKRYR